MRLDRDGVSRQARHEAPADGQRDHACVDAFAYSGTGAQVKAAVVEAFGEQLYSTHCVACHTNQMHWRHDRQAFDIDSLKFQLRRWLGNAGLTWNDADIAEVSRYLNEIIYYYPQVNGSVGLVSGVLMRKRV